MTDTKTKKRGPKGRRPGFRSLCPDRYRVYPARAETHAEPSATLETNGTLTLIENLPIDTVFFRLSGDGHANTAVVSFSSEGPCLNSLRITRRLSSLVQLLVDHPEVIGMLGDGERLAWTGRTE